MAKYITFMILVGAMALANGCSLDLGDSPFLCNKGGDPECPTEYNCVGNYCVKEGSCPVSVPGCNGTNNEAGPPDGGTPEGGSPPDMVPLPPDQPPIQPDMPPPPPDLPPALAGYGSKCGTGYPACQAGLECVGVTGWTISFCTKQCFKVTDTCTGTPLGTRAYCMIGPTATGKLFCAFYCRVGTQTWSCPANLTCSSTPYPVTSTQYLCQT